jgi:ATP-dependent Clp protease ATP-binding subunit ClpA
MADRFDKFTEHARRVLTLALEESQRFNHTDIGTEHLLLGLLCERDALVAKVLAGLDVDLDALRAAVESKIVHGDRAVLGEIDLTSRGKRTIDLAIVAEVLESFGVELERPRHETARVLTESGPEETIVSDSHSRPRSGAMRRSLHPGAPDAGYDGPPSLHVAQMALEALRIEKDAHIDAGRLEQAAITRGWEVQMQVLVRRMEQDWKVDAPQDE